MALTPDSNFQFGNCINQLLLPYLLHFISCKTNSGWGTLFQNLYRNRLLDQSICWHFKTWRPQGLPYMWQRRKWGLGLDKKEIARGSKTEPIPPPTEWDNLAGALLTPPVADRWWDKHTRPSHLYVFFTALNHQNKMIWTGCLAPKANNFASGDTRFSIC